MRVDYHPVTADRWSDLEALFASASATRNCFCMWWRIPGQAWRDTDKPGRRAAFRSIVSDGPPPGILAYGDGVPAGWVQVTPRRDVPRFNAGRTSRPDRDADLARVWALSCFFIGTRFRRQGLMEGLARAACDLARDGGADCVEAAVFRPTRALQWSEGYVGLEAPLARAGFDVVEDRGKHRRLMRWRPRDPLLD